MVQIISYCSRCWAFGKFVPLHLTYHDQFREFDGVCPECGWSCFNQHPRDYKKYDLKPAFFGIQLKKKE